MNLYQLYEDDRGHKEEWINTAKKPEKHKQTIERN